MPYDNFLYVSDSGPFFNILAWSISDQQIYQDLTKDKQVIFSDKLLLKKIIRLRFLFIWLNDIHSTISCLLIFNQHLKPENTAYEP